MKLHVVTIFDRAVSAYMAPFFTRSLGEAERMLADTLSDPNHLFAKHPSDYRLYGLGVYDDTTGTFELHATPEFLVSCETLQRQLQLPLAAPSTPSSDH